MTFGWALVGWSLPGMLVSGYIAMLLARHRIPLLDEQPPHKVAMVLTAVTFLLPLWLALFAAWMALELFREWSDKWLLAGLGTMPEDPEQIHRHQEAWTNAEGQRCARVWYGQHDACPACKREDEEE